MTLVRAEASRGPTSLAETARLSGEFADWHNIVACVVWLTGELDIAALRKAWRGVCLSHDVLRRSYVSPDEACTYGDVLGEVELHTADTDAEALATVQRILEPPFDLAGPGLSRFVIVQRDDRRHLLGIALDHIICDQVTWERLMRDFGEFYERATQGASVPDKVERNAYQDFASLEHRNLSTAWGAERRQFWRSQTELFGTYPPVFPFPCESTGEHSLTAVDYALPADTNGRIRDIARQARSTPFITASSAVLAALREVSGAPSVGVMTNHHGRVLPGTSDTAGLFARMVPLHLTARSRSPIEAVREVFSHALDVFEYSLPLWVAGRLWNEELASADRNAGVQVRFNEPESPFGESFLVGTKAEPAPFYLTERVWSQIIQFKWELDGTAPQLCVSYDESYFSGAIVDSLIQAIEKFVLSADG